MVRFTGANISGNSCGSETLLCGSIEKDAGQLKNFFNPNGMGHLNHGPQVNYSRVKA